MHDRLIAIVLAVLAERYDWEEPFLAADWATARAIVDELGVEPARCYFGPKKDHWKPSTLFYRIHCLDPDELV